MENVIILVHLMVVLALVLVVLLQRSEGGALGIGGGGGGMMSNRGSANVLTRVTTGLAIAFFLTSIVLTILARQSQQASTILETVEPASISAPADEAEVAEDGEEGEESDSGPVNILDALKEESGLLEDPEVPETQ